MWATPYLLAASLAAYPVPASPSMQEPVTHPDSPNASAVDALKLPSQTAADLRNALAHNSYRTAEALLLAQLQSTPETDQKRRILVFLGSIYFLDKDALQAAVAWQKASAFGPLPEDIRFSLAMAYIQMQRRDWAARELLALHQAHPADALYPFWLGRITYDSQKYGEAAGWFRIALRADPGFVRAHDNLGLCLYDMNDVDGAVAEYLRAIALQQNAEHPSPWPYLNLAIAEEFRGNLTEAAAAARRSIAIDPKFAQAHYRLGNIDTGLDHLPEAIQEMETAATLDKTYAEPHAALARLYRRQGDAERSRREVEVYRGMTQKKDGANDAPLAPERR